MPAWRSEAPPDRRRKRAAAQLRSVGEHPAVAAAAPPSAGVGALGDFHAFAINSGAAHCIKKYLARA